MKTGTIIPYEDWHNNSFKYGVLLGGLAGGMIGGSIGNLLGGMIGKMFNLLSNDILNVVFRCNKNIPKVDKCCGNK